MYVMYYAPILRYYQPVRILVKTNHSCLRIRRNRGCHRDSNQYTHCKGNNLTTRPRESRRQHEWPPFTMTIKESGWVLPHPSAVFHIKTLTVSLWVAQTLSQCTSMKRGKVSSNSATVEATKFVRPYKSYMLQYINLVHRDQTIGPKSTQTRAITFRTWKYFSLHPSHPVFSIFS
jgi:hypothetical protein